MPKEKFEQISPKEEFEKIEKERVSSGMLALYPELWGPVEKERKEEIIKAVKVEIKKAMSEDDFGYVEKLSQELNKYLGKEATKEYAEAEKPHKLEARLGSKEIVSDLNTMAEERGAWEDAKKRIDDKYSNLGYCLVVASGMARLNPERFKNEVKISDKLWQEFLELIEKHRPRPDLFALVASDVKVLDPERFNKDVKIDDKDLDGMAEAIKEEKSDPECWVALYDAACQLKEEEIKKRVPITKSEWGDVQYRIRVAGYPEDRARLAGQAQRIKPERMPDIVITKEEWRRVIEEFKDALMARAYSHFFVDAGNAKDLKVE